MIKGLFIILLFQLLGEAIQHLTGMLVPSSIIGMILLFLALPLFNSLSNDLTNASHQLIQHMSLLLIPSVSGFIFYLLHNQNQTLPILTVASLGTVVVIVVTALVMNQLVHGSHPMKDSFPKDPKNDS
ncbi:MAG: CidA/LrgA family protein [Endozoicomonadaceae bacterium]|nr:CidA/LrgA family protein [Endozoicomonadaceae bacterium]